MYLRWREIALLTALTVLPLEGGELLNKIERNMGSIKTVQCEFYQEKHLNKFPFPLKITGIMCADQQQGRFAWRVKTPMISNAVIADGKITQYDGDSGKVVEIASGSNPALKMLTDTLRILFAGDIKNMLKDMEVEQESNPLVLKPVKNALFSKFLQHISIRFSSDLRQIEEIVMLEKSGDKTIIKFFNASINTPIKDSLWQAVPRGE